MCGVDIEKGDATKATLVVPASETWSTANIEIYGAKENSGHKEAILRMEQLSRIRKALTAVFEPVGAQLTRLGELSRIPGY